MEHGMGSGKDNYDRGGGGGGRVRWEEVVEGYMGRVGGDGDGRGIRKWAQDGV